MTKYIGPKTDGENVATQSDVGGSALSDATPDALTPDQAGAAGTANAAARADHAHEIICAAAGAILPDDIAAEGTASTFARSDHTHSISAAAPGTITPDAAAAEGSSTSFARADHTHAIVAAAPATNLTASTTNAEGNATSFARSNHTHAIDTAAPSANLTASTTNAVGTSANLARSDHSHAITTGTPGAIQPDDSASAGSSANLARADHRHSIAAAAASTITGTNAEGSSTSFARADHDHALSSALSNALAPTGSVMAFAGSTAPSGWLLCDGSEQPVATYGALDTVLGTTYGNRTNGSGGEGSSHFRLPDLRGRVPAGKDDMGGSAASRLTSTVLSASNTLGATGGTQTHLLTGAESGTSSHSHSGTTGEGKSKFYRTVHGAGSLTANNHQVGFAGGNFTDATNSNWANSDHTHDFTTNNSTAADASNAHTNTQPTLVLNYIIKT